MSKLIAGSVRAGLASLLLSGASAWASGNTPPPPPCREDVWVATGDMGTPRNLHAAVLLPSGKVLVSGGFPEGNDPTASAELYDPAAGTWSPTGTMNVVRGGHTATLLPDGQVFVAGGWAFPPEGQQAEIYDPEKGQWTATAPMTEARQSHTATLLPSGKVLVAGGIGSLPYRSAELFDPSSGTWTRTGDMLAMRVYHTATLLPSGKVLVTGGLGERFFEQPSTEVYDPASGVWTAGAPMTTSRFFHTATLLDSGLVLVAGGDGAPSTAPVLNTAELYDPVAGTWTATGELAAAHGAHTATLLRSGSVLVAGGASLGGFFSIPNSELFDPAQGTWSDAGCLRPPSFFQTATLLSSGAVLVTGGLGESNRSLTGASLYGAVSISPSTVALPPKATQPFTARGGGGAAFTWLLTRNASGATLTPDGQYTAGPIEGAEDVVTVYNAAGQSASAHTTVGAQLVSATATRGTSASGCSTVGGNAPFSLLALLTLIALSEREKGRHGRKSRDSLAD